MKTRVSSLALLLLTVSMMLGLASCNLGSMFCQHQWKDATCTTPKTCSLCSKTEGAALGHSGGTATCTEQATCTVCNAKYGDLAAHAFTEEVVKEEALKSAATCTSAATYYKSCACGLVSTNAADVFLGGRIAKHQYVNGICSVCGFDASKQYHFNFVESFFTNDRISLKVKDFAFETETNDETPDGYRPQRISLVDVAELELFYENGKLGGNAHGVVTVAYFQSFEQSAEFTATIADGYVYFTLGGSQGDGVMYKYPVEKLIGLFFGMSTNQDGKSPYELITPFVADTVLPMIENLTLDNRDALNTLLERALNIFFTFEKQNNDSVLVKLNKEKLLLLNQTLATKPIAEVVDTYFGEEAFDLIVDFAFEILDLKVSEIPAYLKEMGIDYDTLVAGIQDVLPTLGAPEDLDINEMINDPEYANTTIGELIFGAGEDYKKTIEENILSILRNNTIYQLMGAPESIKSQIDDIIPQIFDYANIVFTTNTAGEFTAINVDINKIPLGGSSMSSPSIGPNGEASTPITYSYYVTVSLEILADGKINVTWKDIVDEYNKAEAPLPNSINEFIIQTNQYGGGYIYFQGQQIYLENGYWVSAEKLDLGADLTSTIYINCGNWNNYGVSIPSKYYSSFEVHYATPDSQEFYICYSGQTIKVTKNANGLRATFENGETQNLATVTSDKTLLELAAEIFSVIFADEGLSNSHYVDFYYNTVTKEYAFEDQHDLSYDVDMLGETCDDGFNYTQTCSKCGVSISGFGSGHLYVTSKTDLSSHGICGGGFITKNTCVGCGRSNIYTNMNSCQWTWQETSDGYQVYKCTACNAIKKNKIAYSDKNANCEITVTETYIIIVNGKEIYNDSASYTLVNHNNENIYKMQGDTCQDGVSVFYRCVDCGYVSETGYVTYGHISDTWSDPSGKEINLKHFGVCCSYYGDYGYIYTVCCHACNTEYGIDYELPGCNMTVISEDDTTITYQCTECGIIKKQTQEDWKSIVILILNGKEIYRSVS